MIPFRRIGLALFTGYIAMSVGVVAEPARAATFSDTGEFNAIAWSETVLGGGDVVDTRFEVGGSPGHFLQLETIPMGGAIVIGVYLNSDATWDPSTQGAIESIDMLLDVSLIASVSGHRDGQAFGVALEQDGVIYRSPFPVTGLEPSWTQRSILSVVADGFSAVNADGSTNQSAAVDFSPSGSVITFGFMAANSGSASISGTTIGYDNWRLTVRPAIPEPWTSVMLCSGAMSLVVRREWWGLHSCLQSRLFQSPERHTACRETESVVNPPYDPLFS